MRQQAKQASSLAAWQVWQGRTASEVLEEAKKEQHQGFPRGPPP